MTDFVLNLSSKMILTRFLIFSALFRINLCGQDQTQNGKKTKKDLLSKFQFADVPDFDTEFIYEEVYSPDGIANQLLQNFFNWFCPTIFWFTFLPFYNRLSPIFAPANNQRQFADAPTFNVTEIYQTTFSPGLYFTNHSRAMRKKIDHFYIRVK